jgi:hypothetical protein
MLLLVALAGAYDPVPNAVGVHVSAEGLRHLGAAVAGLAPTSFPVGAITGAFACDDAAPDNVLALDMDPLEVRIHVDGIDLDPNVGRLDITVTGAIDSTAASLRVVGDCDPLADLDETCAVQLPTTGFTARIGMQLGLVDGAIDAVVDTVSLELPPIVSPVEGCTFASAVGAMLGQNPNAITDLILAQVEGSLEDLGPTLEVALEDGLGGLALSTSLSLGEGEVLLALAPSTLQLDDNGLLLGLGATVSPSVVSTCVPAAVPPATDAAWPELAGLAPDGALTYDAAAVVNAQFVDQVLLAAYESGALCVDGTALGGLSLSTGLFDALLGESWTSLFPEAKPLDLRVAPLVPPTVRFEADGAPIRIDLNGLPVRMYALLDGRMTRAMGIALDGAIGVSVPYGDGVLAPALDLSVPSLRLREESHELLAEGYSEALESLLPTILGGVLPADLLPSLGVPTMYGIGLEGLWWFPAGDGSWLGGYAVLSADGVEPIELAGCEGGTLGCDGFQGDSGLDLESALGCTDSSGGCGADGCSTDGGCSSDSCSDGGSTGCAVVPVRPFLAVGVLLLAARRRRR